MTAKVASRVANASLPEERMNSFGTLLVISSRNACILVGKVELKSAMPVFMTTGGFGASPFFGDSQKVSFPHSFQCRKFPSFLPFQKLHHPPRPNIASPSLRQRYPTEPFSNLTCIEFIDNIKSSALFLTPGLFRKACT